MMKAFSIAKILTLSRLGKIFSRRHFKIFFLTEGRSKQKKTTSRTTVSRTIDEREIDITWPKASSHVANVDN